MIFKDWLFSEPPKPPVEPTYFEIKFPCEKPLGTPATRVSLRKKTTRKEHPHDFPSTPLYTPPHMSIVKSNRLFKKWVAQNWRDVLSLSDQALWEGLAAGQPIRNYKGKLVTLDGFRFYNYFEQTWKHAWYSPCQPFDPATAIPDTAPYLPYDPPIKPFDISVTAIHPDYFNIQFSSSYAISPLNLQASICPGSGPFTKPYGRRFLNVQAGASNNPPGFGTYDATLFFNGVYPIPPHPGTYRFRISLMPYYFPYSPSEIAEFQVQIPAF